MALKDISWSLFLCGLGLFLFGVVLMGDGLKSLAGDKLRDYIDRFASKPWQGVLIGALITALIQSSSATTAITIGFIRAGLMSLEQAAGIIIGANVGTTITAFLIGLNISGLAPYFIVAGAFILLFSSNKKAKDIANILVGFGLLFYGISLIGSTLSHLKEVKEFTDIAGLCAKNPLLGLLIGIVMTCAMQSSSAAIGVIQIIYETGAMTFKAILPFLFGSNIGTCVTAIMASLGGNTSASRAAALHTFFNVFGSIVGMLSLNLLNSLILSMNLQPRMEIAVVHIIFNTVTALLVFPFIKQLCAFTKLIIKGEEPKKRNINLADLSPKYFPVASTALTIAYSALEQMEDLVRENVNDTEKYFLEKGDDDDFENIQHTEDLINKIDHSLTKFLTEITLGNMSDNAAKNINVYLEMNKNFERLGDLTVNIAEFGKMINEEKGTFSDAAQDELREMFRVFYQMFDLSLAFVSNKDVNKYNELMELEDRYDNMEYTYRQNHFERMKIKECTSPVVSSIYADILSNFERMGDHCCNIARSIYDTL